MVCTNVSECMCVCVFIISRGQHHLLNKTNRPPLSKRHVHNNIFMYVCTYLCSDHHHRHLFGCVFSYFLLNSNNNMQTIFIVHALSVSYWHLACSRLNWTFSKFLWALTCCCWNASRRTRKFLPCESEMR